MLSALKQLIRIDATKRARDNNAWIGVLRDSAVGHSGYANLGYGSEGDLAARQQALIDALVAGEALEGHWLDVGAGGCGAAVQLLAAHPTLEITAFELDAKRRSEAPRHPRLHIRGGDADRMPWPTPTFDGVLCIEAAHQFRDRRQFAHQAWLALKTGGRLLLADLVEKRERTRIYDGFVRDGLRRAIGAPELGTSEDWAAVLGALPFSDIQVEDVGDQVLPNLEDWARAVAAADGPKALRMSASRGLEYLAHRGQGGPFGYAFVRATRIDER
ncbi:MAG: methyltransferase domain-containing protein [Proteobacteria bacterium]|nr:methyltransferase domain-containing protein [Pseudomonadota bacterium]